jgi:predicted acylesterase/phospholipase RssA
MINDYVIKLIDNLPDDIKNVKEPAHIDLVLDGGIFNGSYLVGALYFLKEMEKRNYIKIDRISGCSIGSIVAFLYYIDALELMHKFYEIVNADFRKTYKLTFLKELTAMYPDDADFPLASTTIRLLKCTSPAFVLSQFYDSSKGFEDQILSKNAMIC